MFGKTKLPQIPGFEAVSDQILVREAPGTEPRPAGHPAAILIYGWGDCLPRHVAKYAEGFQALYPRSRQIVVLAPMSKAMFSGIKARSKHMDPVIDNLVDLLARQKETEEDTSTDSSTYESDTNSGTPSVLVHAISSTGLANYASTLNAFRLHYDRPLPHKLLICDSTPGSPVPSRTTLTCWSRAMALSTARLFPWPFAVTHFILFLLLCVNVAFVWATGQEFPGIFTVRAVDDETLETKEAKRMFFYSKEDDLILYQDIEALSEETKEKGYQIRRVVFEGSGHVKHMQKSPEKYWRSVEEGWRWAQEGEREPKPKL